MAGAGGAVVSAPRPPARPARGLHALVRPAPVGAGGDTPKAPRTARPPPSQPPRAVPARRAGPCGASRSHAARPALACAVAACPGSAGGPGACGSDPRGPEPDGRAALGSLVRVGTGWGWGSPLELTSLRSKFGGSGPGSLSEERANGSSRCGERSRCLLLGGTRPRGPVRTCR